MKNKYLNLFWGILATVIIIHEFTSSKIDSIVGFGIQIQFWLLVFVWFLVGLKNYISFLSKTIKFNHKYGY